MRSASTRKAVSKACDACRRRKIKCNGLRPCAGCLSADLACSFDAPRGQGGNRGARATVLNELRAEAQYHDTSPPQDLQPSSSSLEADQSPGIAALAISEQNTVDTAIDAYVKCIYSVVPLLDVAVIKAHASLADVSTISHQFILAFCAYVGNFGRVSAFFDGAYSQRLLESAVSVQDARNIAQPTPLSVYISFFFYGAWAGQGDYQQAWYHLREATTLFMMLKPKLDDWYDEKAQRCLFWILVVSERYVHTS
jgi:SP family general alpha glucoside:H+ symporter-like MFS transporter